MATVKEEARRLVEQLPEEVTWDDGGFRGRIRSLNAKRVKGRRAAPRTCHNLDAAKFDELRPRFWVGSVAEMLRKVAGAVQVGA
jgi:hypothetical protein